MSLLDRYEKWKKEQWDGTLPEKKSNEPVFEYKPSKAKTIGERFEDYKKQRADYQTQLEAYQKSIRPPDTSYQLRTPTKPKPLPLPSLEEQYRQTYSKPMPLAVDRSRMQEMIGNSFLEHTRQKNEAIKNFQPTLKQADRSYTQRALTNIPGRNVDLDLNFDSLDEEYEHQEGSTRRPIVKLNDSNKKAFESYYDFPEDAQELEGQTMTYFSNLYGDKEGRQVLLTPIKPDGTVMTASDLKKYYNLITQDGPGKIKENDRYGLVMGVFDRGDEQANIKEANAAAKMYSAYHQDSFAREGNAYKMQAGVSPKGLSIPEGFADPRMDAYRKIEFAKETMHDPLEVKRAKYTGDYQSMKPGDRLSFENTAIDREKKEIAARLEAIEAAQEGIYRDRFDEVAGSVPYQPTAKPQGRSGRLDGGERPNLMSQVTELKNADRYDEAVALTDEAEQLKTRQSLLGYMERQNNKAIKAVEVNEKYSKLWERKDFAENSQYDASKRTGSLSGGLYAAVNAKTQGYYRPDREDAYEGLGVYQMYPEEILEFNYLFSTGGDYKQYLKDKEPQLLMRRTGELSEDWEETAKKHPAFAYLGARLANMGKWAFAPVQMAAHFFGADENDPVFDANRMSQVMDATNKEAASKWFGGVKIPLLNTTVGEIAYGAMSSGVDSAVAIGVAMALGGSQQTTNRAVHTIMSGGVLSDSLMEYKQRGFNNTTAAFMAAGQALLSVATEEYSLEVLFNSTGPVWKQILKNAFAEMSEEQVESIAKRIGENILLADRTEIQDRINQLQSESKMTAGEAKEAARAEWWQEFGVESIVAGITGGVFGAVHGVKTKAETNKAASNIVKKGNVGDLKVFAGRMGIETNINEQSSAKEVQKVTAQVYDQLIENAAAAKTPAEERAVSRDFQLFSGLTLSAQEKAEQFKAALEGMVHKAGQALEGAISEKTAENLKKIASPLPGEAGELAKGLDTKKPGLPADLIRSTIQALGERADVLIEAVKTDITEKLNRMGEKTKNSPAVAEAVMSYLTGQEQTAEQKQAIAGSEAGSKLVESLLIEEGRREMAARERAETEERERRDRAEYERVLASLEAEEDIQGELKAEVEKSPEKVRQVLTSFELARLGVAEEIVSKVTGAARQVYELGRRAWDSQLEAKKEAAKQTQLRMHKPGEGVVTDHESVNRDSWTQEQRAAVALAEQIAKDSGYTLDIFQSAPVEGVYRAENGSYISDDGTIRLDVNAGKIREGDAGQTILPTFTHELVHHLLHAVPELGREYIALTIDKMAEDGRDVMAKINEKIQRSIEAGREIGIAKAIEEAVADGSNMILKDSKAVEQMAKKHPKLFSEIKNYIKDYVNRMREAFKRLSPVYDETKWLMKSVEGRLKYADEQVALFDRMMVAEAEARMSVEKVAPITEPVRTAKKAPEAIAPKQPAVTPQRSAVTPKQSEVTAIAAGSVPVIKEGGVTTSEQRQQISEKLKEQTNRLASLENQKANLEFRQRGALGDADARKVATQMDYVNTEIRKTKDMIQGYQRVLQPITKSGGDRVDVQQTADEVLTTSKQSEVTADQDVASERYSVRVLPDGTKYVHVDTDQDIFNDVPKDQYFKIARDYIIERFKGKFVGTENPAYVSGRTAKEYTHPANRRMSEDIRAAKMQAATEIDNILDAAEFIRHADDDGRNPEVIGGWDYYNVLFGVGGEFFEGIVNIKNSNVGRVLYDVTKIKNVTSRISGGMAETNTRSASGSNTLSDNIPENIPDSQGKVSRSERDGIIISKDGGVVVKDANALTSEEWAQVAKGAKRLGYDIRGAEDAKTLYSREGIIRLNDDVATIIKNIIGVPAETKTIDVEVANKHREAAIEEFGYTDYFYDAGFIMPDGEMLNFSGEKDKHFGMRGQDHRAIGVVFDEKLSGTDAMIAFMNEGNIRIMDESPGIDLSADVAPTDDQLWVIEEHVRESQGRENYYVDFSNSNGNSIGQYEYEGGVSPSRVISDIKYFYRTGEVRELSDVQRFSFSERAYQAAVQSKDMAEAQRLVDEAARAAGYAVKAWHGTDEQFFVFDPSKKYEATTRYVDGMYFSQDAEVANIWAKMRADKSGKDSRTIEAYLKFENPLILKWDEYLLTGAMKSNQQAMLKKIQENGHDAIIIGSFDEHYDGLFERAHEFMPNDQVPDDYVLKHDLTGDYLWKLKNAILNPDFTAKQIAVFNSEQIKSADPVTYDDSGKVIPLSERFNPESPDIRYAERDKITDPGSPVKQNISDQTQTQQFKRWFGDSKVVNDDGSPRIVYHGSPNEFSEFSYQFLRTNGTMEGVGFYFTDDQGIATGYSNKRSTGKLYEVYLNISKPLNGEKKSITRAQLRKFLDAYNKYEAEHGDGMMYYLSNWGNYEQEGYQRVLNEAVNNEYDGSDNDIDLLSGIINASGDPEGVYQALKDTLGYDGIITQWQGDEGATNIYVAFGSEQIKSATGNAGTFDRNDKNIYFSERQRDMLSKRDILAGAFDQVAKTEGEKRQLTDYKRLIRKLNRMETEAAQLREMNTQERRKRREADKGLIAERAAQIAEIEQRIDAADRQLLRMQNAAPLRNVLKREGERVSRQAAEIYRARQGDYKASQADKKLRDVYVARIEKNATAMNTWLQRPDKKKYVNEAIRNNVADLLTAMNLSTVKADGELRPSRRAKGWQEAMVSLSNLMHSMDMRSAETNMNILMDIDPDLAADVEALVRDNDNVLMPRAMPTDQLRKLDSIVRRMKRAITMANQMHTMGRGTLVETVAQGTIDYAETRREKKLRGNVVERLSTMLNLDMSDAFTYFESLGPDAQRVLKSLYNQGFGQLVRNTEVAQKFFKGLNEKYPGMANWSGKKATVQSFDVEGGTIHLTPGHVMELYLLNQREQARGHIYGRGLRVEGHEAGKGREHLYQKEAVRVSPADVARIIDTLTTEQRSAAEEFSSFLNTTMSDWGNEVSMTLYGYQKFIEGNYYPIRSDTSETLTRDPDTNFSMNALLNLGMTKSLTKNANNAIFIGDAFTTITKHITDMANYNAFAAPLTDAMKWFNYKQEGTNKSVKGSIERLHGRAGNAYFVNLLKAVNGIRTPTVATGFSGLLNSLAGKMKVAAVAGNARVIMQQHASYTRASAMISPAIMAQAYLRSPRRGMQMAQKYSPIAAWKHMGYFDMNIGRQMDALITGKESMTRKIQEATLMPAGVADDFTLGVLWNAAEIELGQSYEGDKRSEAFYELVGERLTDIIDRTQVVDTVFHRSQVMREKDGLIKITTNFMAEPIKTYNLLMSAIRTRDVGTIARTGAATLAGWITVAMAAGLIDVTRDKEKEKGWKGAWESYLSNVFGIGGDFWESNIWDNANPMNMVPFAKEVYSMASGYSPSRPDMQAAQRIIWAGQNWMKLFEGSYDKSAYDLIYSTAAAISSTTGLPINNIMRDTVSVIDTVNPAIIGIAGGPSAKTILQRFATAMEAGKIDEAIAYYNTLIELGKTNENARDEMMKAAKLHPTIQAAAKALDEGRLADYEKLLAQEAWLPKEMAIRAARSLLGKEETEKPVSQKAESMDDIRGAMEYTAKTYTYQNSDLSALIESGKFVDVKRVIDSMMSEGKDKSTISNAITTAFGKEYVALVLAGKKKEAADLKAKILKAYELAGYDRATKIKAIDKWVTDAQKKK